MTRLKHLEAARGIASIIVIFHHFSHAFEPGLKAPVLHGGLRFTPFYVFFNGEAAVMFFFLLSGYVLSRRLYSSLSWMELARALIKRLPRLMLPAAVTVLAGYAILADLPPFYREAAAISRSTWLASFGNANFPSAFVPSIQDAARQSLLVFLLPNHSYYNTNLWTMFDEYMGSLVVFFLVGLFFLRRQFTGISHILLLIVSLLTHPAFVPFVIGSWLACSGIFDRPIRWEATSALGLLALACFSSGNYWTVLVGSIAIMAILLGSKAVIAALSGRSAAWLGAFSFPIYLVHTLIILSLSSWTYVQLGAAPALLVTLLATFVLSIPLLILERLWVPWLNAVAARTFNFRGRAGGSSARLAG